MHESSKKAQISQTDKSTYRVLSIRCMCEVEKIYKALYVAFNQAFLCRGDVREEENSACLARSHRLQQSLLPALVVHTLTMAPTKRNQGTRQHSDGKNYK